QRRFHLIELFHGSRKCSALSATCEMLFKRRIVFNLPHRAVEQELLNSIARRFRHNASFVSACARSFNRSKSVIRPRRSNVLTVLRGILRTEATSSCERSFT